MCCYFHTDTHTHTHVDIYMHTCTHVVLRCIRTSTCRPLQVLTQLCLALAALALRCEEVGHSLQSLVRDCQLSSAGDGAVVELLTALAEEALDERAPNVSKQGRATFTEQVPRPGVGPEP